MRIIVDVELVPLPQSWSGGFVQPGLMVATDGVDDAMFGSLLVSFLTRRVVTVAKTVGREPTSIHVRLEAPDDPSC